MNEVNRSHRSLKKRRGQTATVIARSSNHSPSNHDHPDVIVGTMAGLLATVPMTAFMYAAHRFLPWMQRHALPPRQITMNMAHAAGVSSEMNESDRNLATMAAHFGYGAAMGAIYGALPQNKEVMPGSGIAFGLAVWTGSYRGLLPAMNIYPSALQQPLQRNSLMIAAHVIWGSALESLYRCYSRKSCRQEGPTCLRRLPSN